MPRKTPPVPVQVIPAYRPSVAFIKARLIDFDTGSAALEAQHQLWLREKIAYAAQQSNYTMWMIGYASKLGSAKDQDAKNIALSRARMGSVQQFARSVDPAVVNHVYGWDATGSAAYNADAADNSADMRAIEVHIFLGDPPPPPSDLKPVKMPRLPLSGPRYSKWAIAAPGGGQGTIIPPLTIGFNVFIIKNMATGELRGYLAPQVGVGWSYSVKGLSTAKNAIQTLLTGAGYSNMDFTELTSKYPITWDELEACLVTVSAAGAGVAATGYQVAYNKFDAPSVEMYSSADTPFKQPVDSILAWPSKGKNYQLGIGGAALAGPLARVD